MVSDEIIEKLKQSFTIRNSSINTNPQRDLLFCKFTVRHEEFRISLNLNKEHNKIYIYSNDKTIFNKDLLQMLETLQGFSGGTVNHVYVYDLVNLSMEEKAELFVRCIRLVDFYVSTKMEVKHLVQSTLADYKNNIVEAPDTLQKCEVIFKGSNNRLKIGNSVNLKGVVIEFVGNNSIVEIGSDLSFGALIRIGYNCFLSIGKRVTSTANVYISCSESSKIIIGDDCMFATGNQLRTDDAHPIYNSKNGIRVNPSKDIIIGEHVWLGLNAIVMGGAHIGTGSIVGMGTVVKKKFPNNCIVAGIPGKIIKKDIFWQRPLTLNFDSDNNDGQIVRNFESLDYCGLTQDLVE